MTNYNWGERMLKIVIGGIVLSLGTFVLVMLIGSFLGKTNGSFGNKIILFMLTLVIMVGFIYFARVFI